MTHEKRSRLTVDPDGAWRLYTETLPAGAEALGTVTREDGDAGALVRFGATGVYAQVNAGVTRSLDGRKVAAALGEFGRPCVMQGGRRVNVYLDGASLETAARIGGGNVSDGIRVALEQHKI